MPGTVAELSPRRDTSASEAYRRGELPASAPARSCADSHELSQLLKDAVEGVHARVVIDKLKRGMGVVAQPRTLEQVIRWTVARAVDHGATVIKLDARRSPGHVIVTISDDGPAMSAAQLAHLFDPPAHPEPSIGSFSGCRRAMRAMGADYRVACPSNEGTTVFLDLPQP